MNKRAFTLIEIIIVLAIMSVVILSAFSLMSFNSNMFGKIEERVDIQSQFRLMMDVVKEEIGIGEEVVLMNTPALTVASDYMNLYATGGRLVKKEGTIETNIASGEVIDGLTITFTMQAATRPNVIHVMIQATGDYLLEEDILLQNDNNGSPTAIENNAYTVVSLKTVE